MKKTSTITATIQGIIVNDKDGKQVFRKYEDLYQKKALVKSKKATETSEKIHLNVVQRQMYRKLMYGLKEYTPQQLAGMNHNTIYKIVADHQKATKALQILKAKKYYKNETNMINAIFPNAKIGRKDMDWLIPLPKKATLKKLGITTQTIIDEFIKRNLLPSNFLKLTTAKIEL